MMQSLFSARIYRDSMRTIVSTFLAVTLLFCNQAQSSFKIDVQHIDARHIISDITNSLAAGRISVEDKLMRLGFQEIVDDARAQQGIHNHANFSARTLLKYAYQRAELGTVGDGNRFLAVLRADAAARSAHVAIDPSLSFLANYSKADLRKPFIFPLINTSSLNKQRTTPAVDKAITVLSNHMSERGIGHARIHILRTFKKPGFNARTFEKALLETNSPKEALIELYKKGLPPPTTQEASLKLFNELSAKSAHFSIDPAVLEVAQELQREVPPDVERYLAHENEIESRKNQALEISRDNETKAVSNGKRHTELVANLHRPPEDPFFPPEPPFPNYSGDPKGPKTPSGSPGPGNTISKAKLTKSYGTYMRRSFQSTSGKPIPTNLNNKPAPVARAYKVAIRSPRAARGVAAGSTVTSKIKGIPKEAYWFPLERDDRFGNLIIKVIHAGKERILTSDVLFSDSFYASLSILNGNHGEQAKYKEGEILVLMSMDPESSVIKSDYSKQFSLLEDIQKKGTQIGIQGMYRAAEERSLEPEFTSHEQTKLSLLERRARSITLKEPSNFQEYQQQQRLMEPIVIEGQEIVMSAMLRTWKEHSLLPKLTKIDQRELTALETEAKSIAYKIPKGVVIHPALYGRDLAWSTSRVDFWFNDLNTLEIESMKINGGIPMPKGFKKINSNGEASTWQFYEQDAIIISTTTKGSSDRISVVTPDIGQGGRFAVTMFAVSENGPPPGSAYLPGEDGVYRLPDLEKQAQPLLDWLSTNHPDFRRLNDFSTSFSILRWLQKSDAKLNVVDMDGDKPMLPTPDRINRSNMTPNVGFNDN